MRDVYFLGVDSGTQSTKVSMINQRGEVLLSASQPLQPMLSRQAGWVEHPDDDLWDSTKAAIKELLGSFAGDMSDIKGIGLCAIRCCRVFLKKDGSLAGVHPIDLSALVIQESIKRADLDPHTVCVGHGAAVVGDAGTAMRAAL